MKASLIDWLHSKLFPCKAKKIEILEKQNERLQTRPRTEVKYDL